MRFLLVFLCSPPAAQELYFCIALKLYQNYLEEVTEVLLELIERISIFNYDHLCGILNHISLAFGTRK